MFLYFSHPLVKEVALGPDTSEDSKRIKTVLYLCHLSCIIVVRMATTSVTMKPVLQMPQCACCMGIHHVLTVFYSVDLLKLSIQ